MLRNRRVNSVTLILAILFSLIIPLSGCGGPAPTPTPTSGAGAVAATPVVSIIKNPDITEVQAGGQVAISAEATGVNLKITWSAKRGKLTNTVGPSTIYTAPDTPGIDTMDVIVTSDSGTTTKTVSFTVIVPTPTATPTSASPTSTRSPTATPVSASATPTLVPLIPEPEGLAVPSLSPRPEDCRPQSQCIIVVKGTWVKKDARGALKLYVLVRPIPDDPSQFYWVQAPAPVPVSDDGQWSASPVYIGQPGDNPGLPFRLCVVATDQTLRNSQNLVEPPPGPILCIDVTRGRL